MTPLLTSTRFTQKLGKTAAKARLTTHWDTWVKESDISYLKGLGVNHLRIPVGYWAIAPQAGDPYVTGSWPYVLKAIGWAKKYGMTVTVCLHGAQGSQNGQDHSGRIGGVYFYNYDNNIADAVHVVGQMAKQLADPKYSETAKFLQVLNEPAVFTDYNYRLQRLKEYYLKAYNKVREVNKDITVVFHDAFISGSNWYYLGSAPYSNVVLDTHLYQVFNEKFNSMTCDEYAYYPCSYIASLKETSKRVPVFVGEWSLATPSALGKCNVANTFAANQLGVFGQNTLGWIYWNFKMDYGSGGWDFGAMVRNGAIVANKPVNHKC